jgi:hypothetical protein
MARPPDGTTNATESRTAVLATVAARASFKRGDEHEAFFKTHGFKLSYRDTGRAMALRRRPAGKNAPDSFDQREWVWDSFEIDAAKLGLELIIAWLPRPSGAGRREGQASLLSALRSTPGIVSIQDCFDDTVLVFAVAHDVLSKRHLQDRLGELCPDFLWAEVRDTDFDQPGRGWLQVARSVAKMERRLETDTGSVAPASCSS